MNIDEDVIQLREIVDIVQSLIETEDLLSEFGKNESSDVISQAEKFGVVMRCLTLPNGNRGIITILDVEKSAGLSIADLIRRPH